MRRPDRARPRSRAPSTSGALDDGRSHAPRPPRRVVVAPHSVREAWRRLADAEALLAPGAGPPRSVTSSHCRRPGPGHRHRRRVPTALVLEPICRASRRARGRRGRFVVHRRVGRSARVHGTARHREGLEDRADLGSRGRVRRSVTDRDIKVTFPSPSTMQFWFGPLSGAYGSSNAFFARSRVVYRAEIADLAARGRQPRAARRGRTRDAVRLRCSRHRRRRGGRSGRRS